MEFIEHYVKDAFILIYFSNGNYLEKLHSNIIQQINSYSPILTKSDGNEFVIIKGKEYIVPKLPKSFTNQELVDIFVNGLRKSKFFIS